MISCQRTIIQEGPCPKWREWEKKVETLTLPMQPMTAVMKSAMTLTIVTTPLVMVEMIIPYEG